MSVWAYAWAGIAYGVAFLRWLYPSYVAGVYLHAWHAVDHAAVTGSHVSIRITAASSSVSHAPPWHGWSLHP